MPNELEPIERASRDELAALQLERLGAMRRHAYTNVSLYRTTFIAAGVHPDDVQSLCIRMTCSRWTISCAFP